MNREITWPFQSPRTGKFESNFYQGEQNGKKIFRVFQSPRTGKFESNKQAEIANQYLGKGFQSPRTGKFESNVIYRVKVLEEFIGFNPLERGNSNQIRVGQILAYDKGEILFQSPRTGKFESNR